VHALGERVEAPAVVERNADQVGDHVRRQLAGDVRDEVARAARRDRVDDAAREAAHAVVEARDHARGEALVHEGAELRVLRRVHVEHHEPQGGQGIGRRVRDHRAARPRRERLHVARDGDDVVVPRDRPEAGAGGFEMPVDGIVLAEPAQLRVRRAAGVRPEVDEVDGHRRRRHNRGGPSMAIGGAIGGTRSTRGGTLARPPRAGPRGVEEGTRGLGSQTVGEPDRVGGGALGGCVRVRRPTYARSRSPDAELVAPPSRVVRPWQEGRRPAGALEQGEP
jgi:hypothetical protein